MSEGGVFYSIIPADVFFAEISMFSTSWKLLSWLQQSWHKFCYSIHRNILTKGIVRKPAKNMSRAAENKVIMTGVGTKNTIKCDLTSECKEGWWTRKYL